MIYSIVDFALQALILFVFAYIVILVLQWMKLDPLAVTIVKLLAGLVFILMLASFFFSYSTWPHIIVVH